MNGRRVTKFELQDGDVIQVGVASLRFLMSEVEAEPEVAWGEDDISLEEEPYHLLRGAKREGDVLPIPEGLITVGPMPGIIEALLSSVLSSSPSKKMS